MEVKPADEKFITELYRNYQLRRDNINQAALFSIKNSAKAYLESRAPLVSTSAYQKTVMEQIRQQAHEKYLQTPSVQAQSVVDKSSLLTQCKHVLSDFLSSLARPVWAGAAITATLLAVIVVNIWTPQATGKFYSAVLSEKAEFVSSEVNTSVDWQYGFSRHEAASREAFMSGVYSVDLINLGNQSSNAKIQHITEQLSTMESIRSDEKTQSALNQVETVPSHKTITALVKSMDEFYQNHHHAMLFKFGNWLEFNYLHAKLALAENDLSIYLNHRKTSKSSLIEFIQSDKTPEFVKKDIDKLLNLFSENNPSKQNVEQQAKVLKKIRTLLF